MPSQVLHALFGEDVVNEIYRRLGGRFGIVADKALEKINREYRAVFVLGCQGPDIFYHSQRIRPVAVEYGGLLHRRGYGVFTANLLKMSLPDPPPDEEDIRAGRREKGINALGVYSLGFMTHAILDRFCHPYIIYKTACPETASPQTGLGRLAHPFFERILDVLMLKRLRGADIASWNQEMLADICEKPPLGLKELLERALVSGYPERAGKDTRLAQRIANAFLDSAHFFRSTLPSRKASPSPRHKFILGFPAGLPGDIDFLNLAREAWQYPAGPERDDTRSFPDIYGEAVDAAAGAMLPCIVAYLEKGIFPIREAAAAIGNGSLSLQDEAGKPCAPERSRPFPLERVLDFM
ncbi:MAG: zinc dependent phospholipase C family protein [Spirochaetaceae bacterium]|jgi:hypothetical protein|nr:zinc dependent phospholipase C family protein [Spirochaetaceae bacterium]